MSRLWQLMATDYWANIAEIDLKICKNITQGYLQAQCECGSFGPFLHMMVYV